MTFAVVVVHYNTFFFLLQGVFEICTQEQKCPLIIIITVKTSVCTCLFAKNISQNRLQNPPKYRPLLLLARRGDIILYKGGEGVANTFRVRGGKTAMGIFGRHAFNYCGVNMEFNRKLQELRKQRGLTQEELARELFVSRTAVSKWESGRGYPGIESLKQIAGFFSLTVDELLSPTEVLELAAKDGEQKRKHLCDLVVGLLDVCMSLLLFLPLFAENSPSGVLSVSLSALSGAQIYLKALYYDAIISGAVMGVIMLALQNCQARLWLRGKMKISLVLGVWAVVLFTVTRQVYAAVFAFVLFIFKVLAIVKYS